MITIKSKKEIKIMKEGGAILANVMRQLQERVKPGVTTLELDRAAEALILNSGAECSFKGYKGDSGGSGQPFPACLCASLNEEIVHGLPSKRVLKEGEILSLDLGVFYKGFHVDMAVTVPVGQVNPETQRLIRTAKKALKRGIKKSKIGNTFGDISNTIQRYIEDQGFSVVRELCGHGIGRELHEDPQILNYGKRHSGDKVLEGMVFCLEPMVSVGDWKIKKSEDGYGYKTGDDSLASHFEHTIAVTQEGPLVLTELK
jgi:methionyl aminopeptidase